eukprot:1138771-Rhodomonas_salina.3
MPGTTPVPHLSTRQRVVLHIDRVVHSATCLQTCADLRAICLDMSRRLRYRAPSARSLLDIA